MLQKTQAFLDNLKINYQVYLTTYPGEEKIIARELLTTTLVPWSENLVSFPLLVVLGGDGTIHEVVNSLYDSPEIPIAYLAAGSGNDFARGLNIPRSPEAALTHILNIAQPGSINLIATDFKHKSEPKLVLNNIGIGLDARIVATANHSSSKKWLNQISLGSLSYLAAVFKVLLKQKSFPVSFTTNNEEQLFKRAYLCTITNHAFFGGGIAIDPTADVNKKEMSIVLLEKRNFFIILYLIGRLLAKKHLSSKYIEHVKVQELTIHSTNTEYCQTDGEIVGHVAQSIRCSMTSRQFWC